MKTAENSATLLNETLKEMVILLALGKSNKEIAKKLKKEVETIRTYRKEIYSLIDCHNVQQIIMFALKVNWITLDEGFAFWPNEK